jgi:hypothetical protein
VVPDCRTSKQFLGEQRIDLDWIDIDQDPQAARYVREKNDGKQIIRDRPPGTSRGATCRPVVRTSRSVRFANASATPAGTHAWW